MKLTIATLAATAVLATSAMADESQKYRDLRMDTQKTGTELTDATPETVVSKHMSSREADMRLDTSKRDAPEVNYSTRNDARSPGQGYIYGGYGPGNDSR